MVSDLHNMQFCQGLSLKSIEHVCNVCMIIMDIVTSFHDQTSPLSDTDTDTSDSDTVDY